MFYNGSGVIHCLQDSETSLLITTQTPKVSRKNMVGSVYLMMNLVSVFRRKFTDGMSWDCSVVWCAGHDTIGLVLRKDRTQRSSTLLLLFTTALQLWYINGVDFCMRKQVYMDPMHGACLANDWDLSWTFHQQQEQERHAGVHFHISLFLRQLWNLNHSDAIRDTQS